MKIMYQMIFNIKISQNKLVASL